MEIKNKYGNKEPVSRNEIQTKKKKKKRPMQPRADSLKIKKIDKL